METGQSAKLDAKGQRVSCPSCGRFLTRFTKVEPSTATVTQLKKCDGCHKQIEVVLDAGRVSVALA